MWKGVDPKTGKTYEELLCDGTGQLGVILLGDSAGAHFHIPENWVSAPDISLVSYFHLQCILSLMLASLKGKKNKERNEEGSYKFVSVCTFTE